MNSVARTLAQNGIAVVAVDERGHGASGTRGDIGYLGELDDDLADLIVEIRKSYPNARLELISHSAGGGFALRIAGGPLDAQFERFVLLAPYLGRSAPTNRPNEGVRKWVEIDCIAASRTARPEERWRRRSTPPGSPVIAAHRRIGARRSGAPSGASK
jgi:alpha-beta hydrolase superfamily lysophospholipase